MADIVAPHGSPLAFAVVSCSGLGSALSFYRDLLGLEVVDRRRWQGASFERLLRTPPGASAECVMLGTGDDPVGRILLLEFTGSDGERVMRDSHSAVFGLSNLNFYVRDAVQASARFAAHGFPPWTPPTRHSFESGVGNPVEVLFDGPDGLTINLVELASTDPATRVGQMRAYTERRGFTATGFTPVVTTSIICRDLEPTRAYCERVLQMGVLIDDELSAPHVNGFLRLPTDARTQIKFMQGNHMFGKLALSQPLNYGDDCIDLVSRAHFPNVGYLAQGFELDDLGAADRACAALDVSVDFADDAVELPGLGRRAVRAVRVPGVGATHWLVSRAG